MVTEYHFEAMRRAMVASQLRTTAVNDPQVLDAMGAVPRERFVPDDRHALAYADVLLPLAPGRWLNSPMALGRLLTEAAPEPEDRVLVVGAATGYAAAVLDRLTGSVVALEEDAALLDQARVALGGSSVELVQGPLNAGWAPGAPYDLILIDGAVEFVPEAIVEQLAKTGRLAAAIVEDGVARLSLGRRGGRGFGLLGFAEAAVPPLPGFARPKVFSF